MVDRKSIVHVKFRLRKALLAKLRKEALRNDRSLNEELNQRVAQSFSRADVEALVYRAARGAAQECVERFRQEANRLTRENMMGQYNNAMTKLHEDRNKDVQEMAMQIARQLIQSGEHPNGG